MSRSTALAASGGRRADRIAQVAQRLLRFVADARLAVDGGLKLLLRGERFDRPDGELTKLAGRLADAIRPAAG